MKRFSLYCVLASLMFCAAACEDNQATDPEVEDEKCDVLTYQKSCVSANELKFCSNGIETIIKCTGNMVCNVDHCEDAQQSACTGNATRCDGNAVVVCNNGAEVSIPCPYGCSNNACLDKPAVCTPDGVRCDGSDLVVCKDGVESRANCKNGCANNACVENTDPSCSSDGVRCDGNDLVTCKDGAESRQTCPKGCKDNACIENTDPSCSSDGVRCDGNDLVTCKDGAESRQTCPKGCKDNACIENTDPTCSPDGVRCDGNELVTCKDGAESRQTCPKGCKDNACIENTDPTCSPDGVRCDGNELVTCKDGAESRQLCLNGCKNNACNAECGNNVREGDELCDGDDLGELTCMDLPNAMTSALYNGKPACNSTCDGIETGTCEKNFCGNNALDINEQEFCDVVDGVSKFLNPVSCSDIKGYANAEWEEGGMPGCPADCSNNLKMGTCRRKAQSMLGLEMCHFVSLKKDENEKSMTGYVRIMPSSEEVTLDRVHGRLACGQRENPTYSWGYVDARHTDCPDCYEGEYELIADFSYELKTPGTYDCVFQVDIDDEGLTGGSASTEYLNCPVEYGKPYPQGIADDAVIRRYEVPEEQLNGTVLAYWNFKGLAKNAEYTTLAADDGAFASQSSVSLSDGGKMKIATKDGDLSDAVINASGWSTSSSLSLENAKYYSIKTKTTGYKNISLKFNVAGSSEKIEKHVTVAVNVLGIVTTLGEELVFADDRVFHAFPQTVVPEGMADDMKEVEFRVYTYGVADGTTVRLDDIYILGEIK